MGRGVCWKHGGYWQGMSAMPMDQAPSKTKMKDKQSTQKTKMEKSKKVKKTKEQRQGEDKKRDRKTGAGVDGRPR